MIKRQENINSLIEALQHFRQSGCTRAALDYVSKNGGVFITGTSQHKEILVKSGDAGKATVFSATELSSRGYQGLKGPMVIDHHAVEILAGISSDFIDQIIDLKSRLESTKHALSVKTTRLDALETKYLTLGCELETVKGQYEDELDANMRWHWLIGILNKLFKKRNKKRGN